MWKDYSASFIKQNRASSISIMVAAFISALFLSLLCSLFFNFWNYDVEQIVLEEGGWQGRITGKIDEDDLAMIQNFANVESASVNEELSEEPEEELPPHPASDAATDAAIKTAIIFLNFIIFSSFFLNGLFALNRYPLKR